jgi:hypothetical protein
MLRNGLGLVLAITCFSVSSASADFMEQRDGVAADSHGIETPRFETAGASNVGLWHDSGYLEVGYYAVEGQRVVRRVARPNDASLSRIGPSNGWSAAVIGNSTRAVASRLSIGLVALLAFLALASRRHWWARSRS